METIDVLYVHNIVEESLKNNMAYGLGINSIPLGLFGLLDQLQKQGFTVRGISDGISKIFDTSFDALQWLNSRNVNLFIMVDMWNFYSVYNKVHTIKTLKEVYPEVPIVVGGQFASLFFKDIIRLPEVDFMILGDAESPIVQLAQKLKDREKDFSNIPNLVYKQDDNIIVNEPQYFITQEEFDAIDFLNFNLVPGYLDYWKGVQKKSNNIVAFFFLNGKGCKYVCRRCNVFGRDSWEKYLARNGEGMLFRNVENTKRDIERLRANGITRIGFASCIFDNEPYRREFLTTIQYPNMPVLLMVTYGSQFEYLPQLAGNFHPQSICYFELAGGTDQINREWGMGPTMDELHELLAKITCIKILSFELASPYVTLDDVDGMIELMERYKDVPFVKFATNLDSARPHVTQGFEDFLELSKDLRQWHCIFNSKQKAVISKFRDEVIRQDMQSKLVDWKWDKEFGI